MRDVLGRGITPSHILQSQPTPGGKGNGHPQMRELAGEWRAEGWPSHVMLGWPEGGGQKIAYAYPAEGGV